MNAQNVNEILDALAVRFGSTGAHLWGVLQYQAWVEFYVAIAGLCVALIVLALGWIFAEATEGFLLIVGVVAVALALIFVGFGAAGIANPEYFALQKILGAL